MESHKIRNGDSGAIASLRWALAALLLLNGAALALVAAKQGIGAALVDGSGHYYAAGLLCALLGGLCWAMAHAAVFRSNGGYDPHEIPPERLKSYDQATALGAVAIMLWVASLTTFVIGCERASWLPDENRERKALRQADKPLDSRTTARAG
jgi:drug/metabolite transporter (DMT)-like permease